MGGGKVLLNGEVTPGLGGVQQQQQQQQLLPPVPQPPSSWASKVRAGLGSDSSPTLAGSAGSGSSGGGVSGLGPAGDRTLLGVGDMTSGVLDPGGVGEGIQGLPHGMGHHLGPLASSIGGGGAMGPVHGLDMEGGMPGRAVQQSAASSTPGPGLVQGLVGSVGIGLGGGVGGPHQDPLQQQQQQPQQAGLRVGGEGLGNGVQGLRAGDGRRLNGSGALAQQQDFATAQDFAALEIGGGGGGSLGSRGAGAGDAKQQGFDASKNELLGDFPCVRLRGLAADTSVKDILDFFVGLGPVLDIVLEVSNYSSRRSGCCMRTSHRTIFCPVPPTFFNCFPFAHMPYCCREKEMNTVWGGWRHVSMCEQIGGQNYRWGLFVGAVQRLGPRGGGCVVRLACLIDLVELLPAHRLVHVVYQSTCRHNADADQMARISSLGFWMKDACS